MTALLRLLRLLPLCVLPILAACTPPDGLPPPSEAEVARLAQHLMSFGPEVDPEEAARLARISYEYPLRLRAEYGVTDPPLIHNTKVNLGLRPRGLCYQWADDLEARLRQENFRTFDFHRAIANADTLRIDHSVLIVSRRGDGPFDGVVLDGWRNGGRLFWSPVLEDPRYTWVPREEVFARRLTSPW